MYSFAFETSIYKRPTFTGLSLSYDTFTPESRKVNMIKFFTFRVLKIFSDNTIKSEFEQIENLFLSNGYPEEVIVDTIDKNVCKFTINIRLLGPS